MIATSRTLNDPKFTPDSAPPVVEKFTPLTPLLVARDIPLIPPPITGRVPLVKGNDALPNGAVSPVIAESEADAEFVRELAGKYGLPVTVETRAVGRGDPTGRPYGGLENAARQARLEFFESIGIPTVALAHTADDQVETFLMRPRPTTTMRRRRTAIAAQSATHTPHARIRTARSPA